MRLAWRWRFLDVYPIKRNWEGAKALQRKKNSSLQLPSKQSIYQKSKIWLVMNQKTNFVSMDLQWKNVQDRLKKIQEETTIAFDMACQSWELPPNSLSTKNPKFDLQWIKRQALYQWIHNDILQKIGSSKPKIAQILYFNFLLKVLYGTI